eukprot:SAG11_NODE_3468_length_2429_cov_18.805579_2_plen_85_part_00
MRALGAMEQRSAAPHARAMVQACCCTPELYGVVEAVLPGLGAAAAAAPVAEFLQSCTSAAGRRMARRVLEALHVSEHSRSTQTK